MIHRVPVQAIIQARSGSTRLPGKIFETIGDKPILLWVVERLRETRLIDRVVVATSDSPQDDATEKFARSLGLHFHRGSEEDVLDRFYRAMEKFPADVVVRATGDNPLLHPETIDLIVQAHMERAADHTGLSNVVPLGSAAEAVSPRALATAWEEAAEAPYREHVTPYIYSAPERFVVVKIPAPAPLAGRGCRLTVDTPEDLELMRTLYKRLTSESRAFDVAEVLALLDREPELLSINSAVRQADWRAGLERR